MKKLLATLATAAMLFTGYANADLIRVEAGAGVWQSSPKGTIQNTNNSNEADIDTKTDDETYSYLWGYIKHPTPVIPNIRAEFVSIDYNDEISIQGGNTISIDGTSFGNGDKIDVKLDQMDVIAYYNILDNTFWLTLDLGLDVKIFNGHIEATDTATNTVKRVDFDFALPMAYARSRVNLPLTGLGVEGIVKYIGFGDSNIYDAQAKIDYVVETPLLDLGIEFGYRIINLTIDSDLDSLTQDDIRTDIAFSGPFAGVVAKF